METTIHLIVAVCHVECCWLFSMPVKFATLERNNSRWMNWTLYTLLMCFHTHFYYTLCIDVERRWQMKQLIKLNSAFASAPAWVKHIVYQYAFLGLREWSWEKLAFQMAKLKCAVRIPGLFKTYIYFIWHKTSDKHQLRSSFLKWKLCGWFWCEFKRCSCRCIWVCRSSWTTEVGHKVTPKNIYPVTNRE